MHASNETLSRYVHLASEMIHLESSEQGEGSNESTQVKVRLQKIFKIADRYDSKEMSDKEALDSLLATISELYKFISLKSR